MTHLQPIGAIQATTTISKKWGIRGIDAAPSPIFLPIMKSHEK
jgi:hypothetical protein